MKIDFSKINQEEFVIREKNGLFLIKPMKTKWKWKPEELHLRSLLCKPDGTVVSAGFPKFFNYGEFTPHDILVDAILLWNNGVGHFTEKLDGTLIIRSVIDSKVNIRTRGTFDLEEEEEASDWNGHYVYQELKFNYSKLFDPDIPKPYNLISDLFEYISPRNRIVIKYEKQELVYLGFTYEENDELKYYLDFRHMGNIYDTEELKIIPTNYLRIEDVKKNWSEAEGVVFYGLHYDGRWVISKIKSDWYMRMHAFKYSLTEDKVRKFCYFNKIDTWNNFKKELFSKGFDEELVEFAKDYYFAYENDYIISKKNVVDMSIKMNQVMVFDIPDRKGQVLKINEITEDPQLRWLGIALLDGQEEDYIGSHSLKCTRTQFKNLQKQGIREWL